MKKNILIFWTLILTNIIPSIAFAYLVPVIGGIWWLIVTVLGFIAVISTFIWIHIIKFKNFLKEKRKGKNNNKIIKNVDSKVNDNLS